MKKFLKSGDLKGFNKGQYQKDIEKKLDPSLRYMFHILNHPYNLRKEELYDRLNAQTLSKIFQNLLTNFEQKSEHRHEKYDFRTVELARLMFQVSAEYLSKAKMFEDSKFLPDEIERVAERFFQLSKSIFENEKYLGEISKEKEIELQEKLEQLKQHEYYKLSEKRNKLIQELEEKHSKYRKPQPKIKKQIDTITKQRNKAEIDLKKKKQLIHNELKKQCAHLEAYFCGRKPLKEFKYVDTPHIFTRDTEGNPFYI